MCTDFFVNKTFFKSKGRGDERERQQRDQLQNMERRVALSIREADTAEAKLELMDGVINKLKVSTNIYSFDSAFKLICILTSFNDNDSKLMCAGY